MTADGAGPHWPLDVAGGASWSSDGRWLVSCTSEFLAARWMGSERPSRVTVRGGGCSTVAWAPRSNTAVAMSRGKRQMQLLSFAPGEVPHIAGSSYEMTLAEGERLHAETMVWSPTGNGFVALVSRPRWPWSIRWVDTVHEPGTVRSLVTGQGYEAGSLYPKIGGGLSCWWSPNGVRIACAAWKEQPEEPTLRGPPGALALFETEGNRVSSRHLFEGRWFSLEQLGWLDEHRIVFTDRDATRLLDVREPGPPLILSATGQAFAISPVESRVAYVNHQGLCLRDSTGDRLGDERVVLPRKVQGVTWSGDGRHLYTHRADERALLVVINAASGRSRIEQTEEAPPGLKMYGGFSEGSTLFLTRARLDEAQRGRREQDPQPLTAWSLPEFSRVGLIPKGFGDSLLAQSPDDKALVLRSVSSQGQAHLALFRDGQLSGPTPIGEDGSYGFDFQPGSVLAVRGKPAPQKPYDPQRERVLLPSDHPISLGTAYVVGSMRCTGVLIDRHYVLTAHHCVADRAASVTLGRHRDWEQTFEVPPHRILHHPDARYIESIDMFAHDLAVLELSAPAPPQSRPFPLAEAHDYAPGTEVFLAGYGGDYLVGLATQPEPRYAISTLVAAGDSVPRSIRWRSAAGADNGGCRGDSGGPVLVRRPDQSFALLGIYYGMDTTDYAELCGNSGVGGALLAEREWLNDALDKLSISRRGSGPPRPRRNRF